VLPYSVSKEVRRELINKIRNKKRLLQEIEKQVKCVAVIQQVFFGFLYLPVMA
jgi:hypothetical protein